MSVWFRTAVAVLLMLSAGQTFGQTTHDVYLDLDSNPATGCDVATPAGTVEGAEVRLRATVDGDPAQVQSVTRATCVGAAFGAAQPQAAGYPVGDNAGIGGADVIEFSTALAGLGEGGPARLIFVSGNGTGADIVEAAITLPGGVEPPGPTPADPAIIPATGWLALLLLAGFAVWLVRRHPAFGSTFALLLLMGVGVAWAANFISDGQTNDWTGETPIATDDANDASDGSAEVDIGAVFAETENGRLFVRVDVRDLAPTANRAPTLAAITFNVDENAAVATAVGSVTGTDPDAGQTLSYAITAGNAGNTFAINTGSGAITVANAAALDFETTTSFALTVTVTDDGTPALSASATVTIALDDVNEVPQIDDQTFAVSENAPNGTSVAALVATDPDGSAPNATLSYAITAGNTGNAFAIDPATGAISVATSGAITLANAPFALTVRVTDGGTPALDASATVTIQVTDQNDAPVFGQAAYAFALDENSAAGSTVGSISATDPDAGQSLAYAIAGGNTGNAFAIDPVSGAITVADPAPLDFETTPEFVLSVSASDSGTPPLSAAATVTITLNDVNDAPVADDAAFSVAENSSNDTVIGSVVATDPDANAPDNTLAWAITGGDDDGVFAIDPATGEITVADGLLLDFEAVALFELEVTVSDGGGLDDTATIAVTLTDVNEAPTLAATARDVVEASPAGTLVGAPLAGADPDTTAPNNDLTYAITNGNTGNAFQIAAGSGQISVQTQAEITLANTPFLLEVTVTDGGALSGAGIVTINVTDVNDAPSFTAGPDQTSAEDAGPQIGTPNPWATDIEDNDPTVQTFIFLVSNDNNALFAVQPEIDPDGVLSYEAAADANGSAVVTVSLQDSGGVDLGGIDTSLPQTFNITITPVNDTPSFIAGPNQNVLENAAAQTVPGWATGISAGPADEVAQTLTFNITDNTNPDLFADGPTIDPDGTLSYTPAAATIGTADITLTLSDDGGGVDTSAPQTFTINVNNVNDAPTFAILNPPPPANEDAGPQVVPGFASAIDDGDSAVVQILTFDITGNTNEDLFAVGAGPEIDPATGTLTWTPADDANGTATITVVLSDDGGTDDGGVDTSAPQNFTIAVTPVNDAPSFDLPPLPDQGVPQDSGPQTVPGFASAISAGPPDEASQLLTFNVSNDANGLFSAQPSIAPGGTLTYTPGPGQVGTATVTVTLSDDGDTDNGGADTSAPQTFDITLEDVNELPVPTATPSSPIVLVENTAPGTLVTELSPNDPDAGQTHTYSIESGNVGGAFLVNAAGELRVDGLLDFETLNTYALVLRVTDDGVPVLSADLPIAISLSDVNEAPGVTAGGLLDYIEGDGVVVLDAGVTVSDADAGEGIESALVQITGNYADGEDLLGFVDTPNISGLYDPVTGALALSGADTPAAYEAALRSVTYLNTSNAPSTLSRTVSWQVDDGLLPSNIPTSTIDLTTVNSAPQLVASGGATAYAEDDPAVPIDPALAATDPDSTQASGATVSISAGFQSGEDVLSFVNTPNIFGIYDALDGVLTLSGDDSLANYEAALRSVAYANTSDTPDTAARTLRFVLLDDLDEPSAPADKTVTVSAANDAPQITLSGAAPSFTENGAAVVVDGALVLDDVDDTNLESATVSIVAAPNGADEALGASACGGLGVSGTNPLTITGSATLAAYETCLRSVAYSNASENPDASARTIRFVVNDGDDASPAADAGLALVAVNDAPVNVVPGIQAVDEDVALTFSSGNGNPIGVTDVDAGTGPLSVTLAVVNGTADVANGGGATIGGDASASVTISGTLVQVNAALATVIFNPTPDFFGAASLQISTNDNGNTGTGGTLSDTDVVTINVAPVNDPPVADDETFDTLGNTELRIDLVPVGTPHLIETTGTGTGVRDGDADPVEGHPFSVTSIAGCADLTAPYDCTLPSGSLVSMNADGTFTFRPSPTLATGVVTPTVETFDYVITDDPDGAGTAASDTGTVTVRVFDKIWYVRAGASGNGRSDSPLGSFTGISGAGGAGDSDGPDEYIFVHHTGTNLNSSIELEANQHLLGEDVGLSIPRDLNGNGSPTVLVANGPNRPSVNASGTGTVRIGNAIPAEIRGLALGSVGGDAISIVSTAGAYTGAATLTISENDFLGAGAEGIDVDTAGGTAASRLTLAITGNTWITSGTHTGNAIDIVHTNVTPDTLRLDISDNTNIVSAASGIAINGGAVGRTTITRFANNSIHGNTAGAGASIQNVTFDATPGGAINQVTGGTLAIGVSGNPVGGAGFALTASQGSVLFNDLDVFAAAGTGLQLGGAGTGLTFAVTPNVGTIDADNGPAVDASAVALDLRLQRLDSNTVTSGVSLNTVSGQFGAEAGGSIVKASGGGTAFAINGSSVTSDYQGALNVTSGAGVSLTSNTSATMTFRGGMTLSTGTNAAFNATGGGTVHVCDESPCNAASTGSLVNALTTTTGTALNVVNTTIGTNRLEFRSIASNGASSGIVLNNTGTTAGLTVTGTGSANSGGTIQNASGDGVVMTSGRFHRLRYMTIGDASAVPAQAADATANIGANGMNLTNADDIELRNMKIARTGVHGIRGTGVTNLLIADSQILNAGNGNEESGLHFGDVNQNNLEGTVAISNTVIDAFAETGIFVENFSGTVVMGLNNVTIGRSANTFCGGVTCSENGILARADGTSRIELSVQDSEFPAVDGNAIFVVPEGPSGSADVSITGTRISDADALGIVLFGGDVVGNANLFDFDVSANTGTDGIYNANSHALTIQPNGSVAMRGTVANTIVNGSILGYGIEVPNDDDSDSTIAIQNNTVSNTDCNGIRVLNGNTADIDITIRNNNVSEPLDVLNNGICHGIEVNARETSATCLDTSGNTSQGANVAVGHRLRQRDTSTFGIERLTGAGNNVTNIANHLVAQNAAGDASATVATTYQNLADGACPMP